MVVNWIKGDVVLCRDAQEFSSPNWQLARVTQTHPGTDGKVRVVNIKMNGKELQCPVNKLVRLPEIEQVVPHVT